MTQSLSPWRKPGARRIIAVAGVSAVVLAAAVGPSSASGSSSTSVTVATSVNGVVGAPAFTGELSTVAFTVTNQSLTTLAAYAVVVPKGIGTVTNLGDSNPNWTQRLASCGLLSNCSALYIVSAKTSSARLPKGGSITSSFGMTAPAIGTAQFRIVSVGDDSGLVVVGSQPTVTIVNGAATKLEVKVTPPVVKGQPNTVTVRSLREYPTGTFTEKPFPGPLTLETSAGTLSYVAPDVTNKSSVPVDVTFNQVQVSPLQKLTAKSGPIGGPQITGFVEFEVVAAGVKGGPGLVLTGAEGNTYTAQLPNGSNGDVTFTEVPCSALPEETTCNSEVNLFGNFKDPVTGQPLYDANNPAGVLWKCPVETCPATPAEYGSFAQDQWVDFDSYPIEVSLFKDNTYTDFAAAGPCSPIVTDPADIVTGKITGDAIAAGFCIDVYAISRDGSFEGDLTIPVLFFEDPKLRGL